MDLRLFYFDVASYIPRNFSIFLEQLETSELVKG